MNKLSLTGKRIIVLDKNFVDPLDFHPLYKDGEVSSQKRKLKRMLRAQIVFYEFIFSRFFFVSSSVK